MSRFFTFRAIKDIDEKTDYLMRWSLWLPFGISLKLHKIVRPDRDRCEHDHPWWFVRIILYGGYTESVKGKLVLRKPWRPWAPWRIYPCLPSFRHSIKRLSNGRVNWSLVLCGRNKGRWGFYTRTGWVTWQKFLEQAKKAVAWCE